MGMRVHPSEFQRLNLRCHTLLSDALLHDVWAIPLDDGGPGRSIRDARAILFGDRRPPTNLAVRGLFKLRGADRRMTSSSWPRGGGCRSLNRKRYTD